MPDLSDEDVEKLRLAIQEVWRLMKTNLRQYYSQDQANAGL
jgi:hypothetical protein